ncbi:MAG: DUF655 domain-containing protein [Candidatus Bathyarchaeia archaeon]
MSVYKRSNGERELRKTLEHESYAKRMYEEYAYVLDYLPTGRDFHERYGHVAAPTVQTVGESHFTLLELELKPGTSVSMHERLYVGRDKRDKVARVLGRISYEELTATAKVELPVILEELIKRQEDHFVEFFNRSQPITPRMHALELLPGIGKKSMWQIIEAREKKPFQSFSDIQTRAGIPDPAKTITKRIIEELSGESKYRIFIRAA